MNVCAILVGIGITIFSACPPPPPQPDHAAIEIREFLADMKRQEQQADEKLDWLYGKRPAPESIGK